RPVVDAQLVQQDPGGKCPQHVECPVRKVDHAEKSKNHRKAEAEHGVEGAIDEPEQDLAHEGLMGYAENFHGIASGQARRKKATRQQKRRAPPGARRASNFYFLISEHLESATVVNACSPGTVATSL